MDSLHAILFYASSAVALVGAVLVALLPGRGTRALALFAAGVGVAGIDAALSAGFTAGVVLVTFAGCAALVARHDYRSFDFATGALWRQLGAAAAAVLLVALAYAAYRGLAPRARALSMHVDVTLVTVLFVAVALVAAGAFTAAWRRDAMAALAGIPLMLAGAGVALVGVTRFAARASAAVQTPSRVVVGVSGPPLGQEAAVLLAVAALALVAIGVGVATRGAHLPHGRQEGSR